MEDEKTPKEPQICEAFMTLANLCIAAGDDPLNKHAGCWEFTIDKQWNLSAKG